MYLLISGWRDIMSVVEIKEGTTGALKTMVNDESGYRIQQVGTR